MMDHEKIKEGVRLMLEGIGEDVNREGLLETPDRIARMCEQIYGGLYEDAGVHLSKQFHATNNNIVLEKDITFYSTCEHHLLPFYGKAHVAYIPDQRVAGLSKLARHGRSLCKTPADPGKYDRTDCGRSRRTSAAEGCDGHDRGRTYVYDHARCSETRQQNCDHHRAWSLCGRFFPAADLFTDGKGLNLSWNSELL